MNYLDNLFIDVYTSGIGDIDLYTDSYWNQDGFPVIEVYSSGEVPVGAALKTLLYPSGDYIDESGIMFLLSDAEISTLRNYINNSGYYYGESFLFESGIQYNKKFNLSSAHQNSHYYLGYMLYYSTDFGETTIYEPVAESEYDLVLSKACKPQVNNINVKANFYSQTSNETYLQLRVYRNAEIANYNLSTPSPYIVTISGIPGYYDPSGNLIGETYNSSNYFGDSVESGMFINLLYISGVPINGVQEAGRIFNITLHNIDQDSSWSPPLIFNTSNIKKSSDDFDEGQIDSFTDVNVKKIGEYPITDDVLHKRRLSIGIEDISLISEEYAKKGIYVSDYYTMDDPIYTYSIAVGSDIPKIDNIKDYQIVKWYVQFHTQDWIRISPINKGEEYENGILIPKFLVLDELNMGTISTQLSEIIYDFSAYSFRVKVEIDMSFISTINYLTPTIFYYESRIMDRNAMFRV